MIRPRWKGSLAREYCDITNRAALEARVLFINEDKKTRVRYFSTLERSILFHLYA